MTKQDYKTLLQLRCEELEKSLAKYDKACWLYHVITGRLEANAQVLEELDLIEEEPQ